MLVILEQRSQGIAVEEVTISSVLQTEVRPGVREAYEKETSKCWSWWSRLHWWL